MSNFKKKEVMDYLTRKPVTSNDFQAAIDISKLRSRILPQAPSIEQPETDYQTEVQPNMVVPPQDVLPKGAEPVMPFAPGIPDPQYRQIELASGGRVKFADAGSVTLPINPMLDNVNPNTIGGAAIVPAAGITVAAIADKFNISLEKAKELLLTLYTGPSVLKKTIDTPEGKVFAPDEPIPAKPDIEKFPGEGERETTLVTEQPSQIKKDIGLTPPSIDNRLPGFGSDQGEDTSVLYATKFGPDVLEKFKKMRETNNEQEILDTLGISKPYQTFLAKKLGLPSKQGNQLKSKIYTENIGGLNKEINTLIDKTKTPDENFEIIFPQIKDKDYLIASNTFGKPSEISVRKKINENLMNVNSLTVEEYKTEMKKMIENRAYAPDEKFFDPLGILKPTIERTPEDVKTYKIPNRDEARKQMREEVSNFDELYRANVSFRKKQAIKQRELLDEDRRLNRIEKRKQSTTSYLERVSTPLSERERLINLVQGTTQKQANANIKENPELLISYLNNNPEKLKLLGSRVNRKTGEIYFQNPNLSFLNKDPNDTGRFFEMDHARPVNAKKDEKGVLLDVPENRNVIPKVLNLNFKQDAEAFIESLDFKKGLTPEQEVNLKAVLDHAKKVKVRLRPNIEKGILKTDDFYRPLNHPLNKINDHISFWAPDFAPDRTILPLNRKGQPIIDFFKRDYGKKEGGRVHLKNGTEDMYLQEIPSLGLSDPIDILEQQLANEKDTQKILALSYILDETKKRKLQEETKAAEYKKSQKEKGIRYMEDFPSQTDYFAETTKQLFTNPKYFYGKGLKGVTEGTEWLVGQPLQILFNQEGKNWEWYHPQAGEKLGINKFIEENIPKGATTGTLALGETAEIAGTFMDPFLAYGIVKGAMNTSKLKKPVQLEEKIDPTRRDLLKTGAILTGGAIVYPTAKKLGLLETGVKAAKVGNAVRVATHQVVDNMPEFFPYLSELSFSKGKRIGEDYMRSGMTEFKREITIPLELNTIEKGKTNVKFEFIHDPAEGNVTAYYTNPLTDEKHAFEFSTGKQGKQAYGVDPEYPNAWEYYAVEVEPPNFNYKAPTKSDPYRKDFDYYDTATEGDDVIKALDKWYKELPKAEKEKFEKKFITHSEYADEIPAASYTEEENYPIMEFMYPKKKND